MPSVKKQNAQPSAERNGGILSGWPEPYIKMLLYGEGGSGKTTLASTFPAPLVWLLCSGGRVPGELRSVDTPENRQRITPYVINSVQDVPEILAAAQGFKTVVLDHITGLQDLVLREVLGLEEIPVQKYWGMATQAQYGQCIMQCKEICRNLLNLPANCIIIAQERVFNGRDDNEADDGLNPTVGASASPKLAGWINFSCDYVVRMYKRPVMEDFTVKIGGKETVQRRRGKGVQYVLQTEPHDVYMTKFRTPKGHPIPPGIEDPSYDKILKVIQGR